MGRADGECGDYTLRVPNGGAREHVLVSPKRAVGCVRAAQAHTWRLKYPDCCPGRHGTLPDQAEDKRGPGIWRIHGRHRQAKQGSLRPRMASDRACLRCRFRRFLYSIYCCKFAREGLLVSTGNATVTDPTFF